MLPVLALDGLKVAVTAAGSPVAVSATLLLKPLTRVTPIVLLAPAPPARRVRVLVAGERLKLDAGIVTVMVLVLTVAPTVPFTVTV